MTTSTHLAHKWDNTGQEGTLASGHLDIQSESSPQSAAQKSINDGHSQTFRCSHTVNVQHKLPQSLKDRSFLISQHSVTRITSAYVHYLFMHTIEAFLIYSNVSDSGIAK